ncbi:MAG: DUF5916 domain-containing protein [Gemmatimonadaceae bacterium]
MFLRSATIVILSALPGVDAACQVATPAPSPHSLSASRAAAPPRIDGQDSDSVWAAAERRNDFRTFAPREGSEPTFRTEMRVTYDDRALYVFVRAFDPHPDSIVRLLSRRDTHGPPNDEVQLWIDSFNDRRSGYEYIVNAAGVKSDYLIFDDTGFDQSWDGVWDVATRVDSLGWTAEYAIPLQQLRFSNREAPVFGIMLWRLVGRTGERVSWPQYRPSRSGYMSQTGTLHGISDLVRSASLEAAPYALARARNTEALKANFTVGGDVRLLPRPNVSVDATFNPDFGQVESDPAVLDLSGFEVFHPERRPFFLEGAGQFYLPLANDGSAVLFHSRRIGRAPLLAPLYGGHDAPTETTILGAARLTARLPGATSLVMLSAVTAEEEGALRPVGSRNIVEPRTYFSVARVQRDFRGGRSGVGLMLTRVDRDTEDSAARALILSGAQAAALTTQHQTADGNYRVHGWMSSSSVHGTAQAIRALQLSNVHGFQQPEDGVRFDSTRSVLRGAGGQLFAGKVAGGITRYDASYRWISPGFDVNELGFLTRAGVHSFTANAGLRATRAGHVAGVHYRTASLMLGFAGEWANSGLSFARGVNLTGTMQLPSLINLQGTLSQQLPGAYCTMSCTRGGPALVDAPRSRAVVDLTGDPRRRVIPHVNVELFRDDEGRSHGAAGQVDVLWRARSNLDASLALHASAATHDAFFYRRFGAVLSDTAHVTVARLDQPVRSITARVNYTVTTTLSVQWYTQAYVSRGTYSNIRELAEPRAERYEDRFRPFSDASLTSDLGGVDFRQFRSNAVVRWEYRPGSALFVVWTQGRDLASSESGNLRLGSDVRELFEVRPANVIAVKVSYWLSR